MATKSLIRVVLPQLWVLPLKVCHTTRVCEVAFGLVSELVRQGRAQSGEVEILSNNTELQRFVLRCCGQSCEYEFRYVRDLSSLVPQAAVQAGRVSGALECEAWVIAKRR